MYRSIPLVAAFALFTFVAPHQARAEHKHPKLHRAIYELREAKQELQDEKSDFNGHKKDALDSINGATGQIEKALEAAGDPYKGYTPPKGEGDIYKQYKHHPHLHHVMNVLKDAKGDLKEAKHNFGGHKEKAIEATSYAIEQVKKCIDDAK